MKKILILCFIIFSILELSAQDELPKDNFIDGWEKSNKFLKFQKNGLFNYINGGAELFLEFGFTQLAVQSYKNCDEELTIEIYEMENPTSALGIYLMKCGNETQIKGISARNSGNRFQFTIVKGKYFVQVNNFTGNKSVMPDMVNFTQTLFSSIENGDSVNFFEYLPTQNLVPGSKIIIRGPYGLQPIYTFGDGDILQLGGKIFAVVGDYKIGNDEIFTQLLIPYPDDKFAHNVFANLMENLDPYLEVLDQKKNSFIFKDYQNKYGTVEIDNKLMKIKIHLNSNPKRNNAEIKK